MSLTAGQRALLSGVVGILLAHGQTTERIVQAAQRLGASWGAEVLIAPGWGETILRTVDGGGVALDLLAATPTAVDMRRVAATMALVDDLCAGRCDIAAATARLEAVSRLPPVSLARFVVLAALGAAALAVVFGATSLPELLLIAVTAGAGALLRRGLAGITRNLFVQPLVAACLASVVDAISARHLPGAMSSLVALCPCMILVPGPHLLNGALDLARGRIPLGSARIGYAAMTTLMICTGLLFGLMLGGASLPLAEAAGSAPLVTDVLAAGTAVLAYGTFFDMPWRMLPIPVAVGMTAHALRWVLIGLVHASPALGAFGACLLVGIVMTPIADWLHLPFAGCAFASVVSIIPGVFLFRMADALVKLVSADISDSAGLLVTAVADGTTAVIILVAMAAGLIIPKMVIAEYQMRSGAKGRGA